MKNLDDAIARFEKRFADQKELDEKQEKLEPVDDGVEKSSQPELTIKDLTAVFEPKRLGDHLPVFGEPADIIRINRERPELLDAVRADDGEGRTS